MPSAVAPVALIAAIETDSRAACRMSSLPASSRYQRSEKPAHTAAELVALNENRITRTIGA